jgi:hypothetical protein
MKLIEIIVSLFLFLYIFECKAEFNSGKTDKLNVEDSISADLKFNIQQIRYIAPQSGLVFLVWKTLNHPLEKSVLWNENTKLSNGLLYTPMEFTNDTFTINLQVMHGSEIEYYFWITKNGQQIISQRQKLKK